MAAAKPVREGRGGRSKAAVAAWALIFGACLAFAGEALADRWYVHYGNGESALTDERWSDAVAELQQALERKGDSGLRVRSYGMRVVDYFPYLKLGIAYYHLGQLAVAKEAFDTEERLGAVEGSPEALQALQRYRQLIDESEGQAAAAARRRVEEVVTKSLADSQRLEGEGDLEAAMQALAAGLAVEPNHPQASQRMETLRTRAVAEEQRQRQQEEVEDNLQRARGLLEEGEAEEAAGLLRQVLLYGENVAARRLLDQAQQVLAASVAAEERQERIDNALDEARRLMAAGRGEDALVRLERVFALAPNDPEAGQLREALLAAQRQRQAQTLVTATLEAARKSFAASRFEAALSAANRVLALEQGNAAALDLIRQAYGQISQRVLGAGETENLPPAIRFADRRQEIEGQWVEQIRQKTFRLSGVVIDRSPATLVFLDDQDRRIEGSLSSQSVGDTYITEFRLLQDLPPGSAAFTVIATDDAGASSRAAYRVHFIRPWFRSPWLWTVVLAMLTLSLLIFLHRRRRQHRSLRARRFNPYVAGGPVFDPDLFYGREPLVQKILQTVHNNSLLLYGERRIGKTSLLHQLHRRLEALADPAFLFSPVYIDLQGTPEAKFFATLADQICAALDPDTERRPALERSGHYSHHDLIRELHGLLKKLRQRSRKQVKVVLLIDEVDELNHYDPRVNQSLRSLFMKRFAENLAAVVAGVSIRKEWEKEGSPWYNFFEEVEVKAIAPEEAARLVVEPVRDLFRFAAGAAERIVAGSAGKPFLIQRRCLALVERLHEEGRRTVTVADVEALEEAEVVTAPRRKAS